MSVPLNGSGKIHIESVYAVPNATSNESHIRINVFAIVVSTLFCRSDSDIFNAID